LGSVERRGGTAHQVKLVRTQSKRGGHACDLSR
jgi:hypothetical protein